MEKNRRCKKTESGKKYRDSGKNVYSGKQYIVKKCIKSEKIARRKNRDSEK